MFIARNFYLGKKTSPRKFCLQFSAPQSYRKCIKIRQMRCLGWGEGGGGLMNF